MNLFKRLYCL